MAIATAVTGCDKVELPYYDGMDAIFFDQQYIGEANESFGSMYDSTMYTHKIYTPVSFTETDATDTILSIKIETAGYVRDYLRPFGVYVVADSTTAIEGEEFELLDDSYAILPGNNSTHVHVKLNLTERMYTGQYQIQLALDGGEHFELPFGNVFGDMPKRYVGGTLDPVPESRNYDPSIHNIFVSCMLQQPTQWTVMPGHQYYLGAFSVAKFAAILEVVSSRGWVAADFNDSKRMPMERLGIVNRMFASYLREKFDKGEYVLEDDGTLMWIKNSLITWAEGITPDELTK